LIHGRELAAFALAVTALDIRGMATPAFLEQFAPRDVEPPNVAFRKLLWFWRCYYSCRSSDRKSLEHSSGIRFAELENTVSALCDRSEGSCVLTGTAVVRVPYFGSTIAVLSEVDLEPWDSM